MCTTNTDWMSVYKEKEALWIHDGNPKRPHALLTSGNHSNGFFNSRKVIPDEPLLQLAASELVQLFLEQRGDILPIHGIIGPQTGATKLAEFISEKIQNYRLSECFSLSPAKDEKDGVKSMIFSAEDLEILPNTIDLLCEDVITTGGSVELVVDAITKAGATALPFILALVNRFRA